MSDTESDRPRIRTVGSWESDAGDDTRIHVDHVYDKDDLECGHPSEGLVGLSIHQTTEDGTEHNLGIMMPAEDAVMLADRILRAAHLVLESREDLPDPEREYRRLTGQGPGTGEPV